MEKKEILDPFGISEENRLWLIEIANNQKNQKLYLEIGKSKILCRFSFFCPIKKQAKITYGRSNKSLDEAINICKNNYSVYFIKTANPNNTGNFETDQTLFL